MVAAVTGAAGEKGVAGAVEEKEAVEKEAEGVTEVAGDTEAAGMLAEDAEIVIGGTGAGALNATAAGAIIARTRTDGDE